MSGLVAAAGLTAVGVAVASLAGGAFGGGGFCGSWFCGAWFHNIGFGWASSKDASGLAGQGSIVFCSVSGMAGFAELGW